MVYIHSDTLKALSKKVKTEVMWPRAYGKTHAFKTFFGMDIATNDSISVNQFVFKDSKGNIQIVTGEEDMCYEGQAPASPREQRLEEAVKHYEQNHLGAQTERFIEMARELGRNDHLRSELEHTYSKLNESNHALMRATEQVAYSDNETQKANVRARNIESNYYALARRHENLLAKNRKAKKPVKKTSKK
jgi:hypothetical protein